MEGLWKVGAKPISQDMLFEAAYNPSSFTFCYQLTPTLTRTKVWLLGICWIIGFGCTPSDGGLRQPALEATRADLRSPVDTAIVQPRAIIQTVQAQGEVFFARQVGLSFEVEGWLISDQKKDGTRVRAGERLATLDTLRIAYQLRQARLPSASDCLALVPWYSCPNRLKPPQHHVMFTSGMGNMVKIMVAPPVAAIVTFPRTCREAVGRNRAAPQGQSLSSPT